MKWRPRYGLIGLALLTTLNAQLSIARAQGTAFTYQGRLNNGSSPAGGIYDLRFAIYDSAGAGALVAGPITNSPAAVSNGLFTVTLDFGPGVFAGADRWLEVGVRTNTGVSFITLAPRQRLAPSPYAIFAGGAYAAGLSGTIPAANIGSGSIGASQLAAGAAAANLQAGGQSAVPGGGMILSSNFNDSNLAGAGYVKLGFVNLGDAWEQESIPALAGRIYQKAIWTGTEMIVWGGYNGSVYFNDGGRYNPTANTWTAVNTNGAPAPRQNFTAVWTGSAMLIWGGYDGSTYFNDGARYNPAANTWTALNTNGAPSGRAGHTAVWTGSEMIVWGGVGAGGSVNNGARYNPATDTWATMTTNSTILGRSAHTAVWTGTAMIVWGGINGTTSFSDGSRYYPAANAWTNVSTLSPLPRAYHTAVWTGMEMIVWGGIQIIGLGGNIYGDGSRYNPATDVWTSIPTNGAAAPRYFHTAVWTGNEMIVWGGANTKNLNEGARYNPVATNAWMAISISGAPAPRYLSTAVWTGSTMIVWGGLGSSYFNDTFSYTPARLLYLYQRP
jgi:N-acetylneuraminic acid mutarotase